MNKTDWERTIEFHGHSCPGLAVGYRVSQIALRELAGERSKDEELVAIVENDACGVDAVQFLTGCTFGKGNLHWRDYGKHVFIFICRSSGKAVRISVKEKKRDNEGYRKLRRRVFSGNADRKEEQLFRVLQEEHINNIFSLPEEEFCAVYHIAMEAPSRARVYNSLKCEFCGEMVSEAKARLRKGKIACIPCAAWDTGH